MICLLQEGESDAWDDTVLIKAYDNAVSAMKVRLCVCSFCYHNQLPGTLGKLIGAHTSSADNEYLSVAMLQCTADNSTLRAMMVQLCVCVACYNSTL